MNNEIMNMIIKIVAAVIVTLITGYIIPFIKAEINNEKYEQILILAEKCVEAAEKIYTPEEWKEKKIYVFSMIEEKAATIGLEITDKELDAIIEGFVLEVKQ